ncbi:CD4-1 molecule isoform X2 [Cynoglossus semilaevis]|uniref:CD4-1 molecule isoform X2 n=1 Tax=Cynoglossus semilaevis TaxID=244447 RepID=UPI000D62D835|nr:T-cell surface glycoprotein CD4-like isoform X2 [Cynoglossus semilaevis]
MATFLLSVFMVCSLSTSVRGAERVVYAREGDTVVLQPGVEPGGKPKYVSWMFHSNPKAIAWWNHLGGQNFEPEQPWKDKLSLSDGALIINKIGQENFGTFKCSVTSGGQNPETTISLRKLTNTQIPASSLLPGELLTLTCKVEDQRTPEIHWLNPRGQKETAGQTEGTVTRRVTVQDSGAWTCVVAQQKSAQISVHVVDLGPVLSHPVYTSTSTPVSIPCSVPPVTWKWFQTKGLQEVSWEFVPPPSSGVPAQRLFFLLVEDSVHFTPDHHRDLRPVQNPVQGNFTLTRHQGREEDRGDYRCTVKFKDGTVLTKTVHLEVLQISAWPGTVLSVDQQVNLTCGVGHPLPSDLQVRWSALKQTSSVRSLNSSHISIPAVSQRDGRKWRCELWRGQTHLTSAVVTLSVSEPGLQVNVLVYACSAAAALIFLIIVTLIFCRRRKHNTRHLRHQLCQCKQPKPKGFYRT